MPIIFNPEDNTKANALPGDDSVLWPPTDYKREHVRFPAPIGSHREQVETLLTTLFRPDDSVELRAVSELNGNVYRNWLTPAQILERLPGVQTANTYAHVYFGVCPRTERAGTKESIATVRCLWADIDDAHVENSDSIFRGFPAPSMLVRSGGGIHAYWVLDQELSVSSPERRSKFERLLRGLYKELGSDSVTFDVSRMLRLPGGNLKGLSDGKPPLVCEVVHASDRTYPISAFAQFEANGAGQNTWPTRTIHSPLAYIAKIQSVEGQHGSNACLRAACILRDAGYSPAQALAELSDWSQR